MKYNYLVQCSHIVFHKDQFSFLLTDLRENGRYWGFYFEDYEQHSYSPYINVIGKVL